MGKKFLVLVIKFLVLAHCSLSLTPASAQIENRFTITGTGGYSSSFSPAYEGGLMLGIRSNGHADFRLGMVYRKLLVTVDHPDTYLSLMAMGSRQIFGHFGFHVQGELRQGSYFTSGNATNEMSVQKAVNLFGNMGVNYQVNERIQLLASYVFQDYDPRAYLLKQTNPHDAGAFKFSVNYTLPLRWSFNSKGYDPY